MLVCEPACNNEFSFTSYTNGRRHKSECTRFLLECRHWAYRRDADEQRWQVKRRGSPATWRHVVRLTESIDATSLVDQRVLVCDIDLETLPVRSGIIRATDFSQTERTVTLDMLSVDPDEPPLIVDLMAPAPAHAVFTIGPDVV